MKTEKNLRVLLDHYTLRTEEWRRKYMFSKDMTDLCVVNYLEGRRDMLREVLK